MKKTLSLILVVCLLFASASLCAFAAVTPTDAEPATPTDAEELPTMTVRFINISKMHYIIEVGEDETCSIFNSSTATWTSNEPLTFRVAVYSTFPYEDIIIYADGVALEPDENGVYTLPNNGGNVTVSASGAVKDDTAPGGKLDFWDLVFRFFQKVIMFILNAFEGKAAA